MRNLFIAVSLLALAAPAVASPYDDDYIGAPYHDGYGEPGRGLPHPGEIEDMGHRLGDVADAIMDVDVGPVADAIDPSRRFDRRYRERTIGDIASRDDPYARERVRASIGAATMGLGAAMHEVAILTPVLRHSIEDAARRIEHAMRTPRGSYYRPFYEDDYRR